MPPKRRKKQANAPVKVEIDCMLPEVKPEPKPKRTRKVKKEEQIAPVIPGWPEWSVPLDYEVPKREPKLEPEPQVEVKLEPKVVPTHSVKTGRRLIARAVRRLRQKRRPRTRKIPLPPNIHDQSKTKYDPKDRPACRRQTYEDTDMSYDEADPDVELLETFHPWRAIRYKKPPKIEKRLTAVGVNTSHLRHYNKVFTRHPESAERIEHTLQRLKVCSEHMFDFLYVNKFVKKFKDVDKKVLDFLESQKTHSKEYLQELINLADHADMNVQTWCTQFDSVQMTRETTDVCIESLFLCFYMATAIHIGNYFNGFALVRPPGHHAQYDCPAGFCVINNVAATAAYLLRKPDIHKVLIIDVDVHHGNGTQELFYDRDDVTYISIHRYEQGKFWPYKRESDYDNIGEGKGKGHNMNVCINENGSHDTDYMYIFTELILPVALELNPDYVIFSLGYDACYGDPIGIMDIEADVFSHMIYHLNPVCNGKILCVLEGGYNHSSVAVGVDNNVRVLSTMKPVPLHCRKAVRESTARSVYDLICVIQPYWPVLWSYYTFLPPHVRKHKQRKPKYVNDQHITTGDINQQKLFDAYMDYEIKLSVPPEYQVFKPSKRFPAEEIPNTKYYYLFGIEDVRHL
uniref:histone deacetylase n=1 Tax=Panagrellus redivivus TaxID=6233 RepID=A0A7E4V4F8_PANRE